MGWVTGLLAEFWKTLFATLAVIALGWLAARLHRPAVLGVARLLLPELRQVGLRMIHRSMQAAVPDIQAAVSRTRDLKILSNKGTDWLGDDNAVLSHVVAQRSLSGLKVRVLLLSSDAPWLSGEWAKERVTPSPIFVREEFDNAHRRIESYMERYNTNLRHKSGVKYHRDDPVWRLIVTDDRAFVSSYANPGQAREAIVLEFEGPNNDSYQGYHRYFNFLWHRRGQFRGSPKEADSAEARYESVELSAGALVYAALGHEPRIVLIERQDGLITLPKGHVRDKEELADAALREIHEETGIPVPDLQLEHRLGWYWNPLAADGETKVFKLIYYFVVKYRGVNLPPLMADTDHRAARWYKINELSGLKFAYSHVERVIQQGSAFFTAV